MLHLAKYQYLTSAANVQNLLLSYPCFTNMEELQNRQLSEINVPTTLPSSISSLLLSLFQRWMPKLSPLMFSTLAFTHLVFPILGCNEQSANLTPVHVVEGPRRQHRDGEIGNLVA